MRATLHIQLRGHAGQVLAERRATNAVMRTGGELIARLFAGKGSPITHMGVGTSDDSEPADFSMTALTNEVVEGVPQLAGDDKVPLQPDQFHIVPDQERQRFTVKVRGTLPNEAAVGTVREAGLFSEENGSFVLYNRVTFAPIEKADDHELTLFWEVSFPYGDLHWF